MYLLSYLSRAFWTGLLQKCNNTPMWYIRIAERLARLDPSKLCGPKSTQPRNSCRNVTLQLIQKTHSLVLAQRPAQPRPPLDPPLLPGARTSPATAPLCPDLDSPSQAPLAGMVISTGDELPSTLSTQAALAEAQEAQPLAPQFSRLPPPSSARCGRPGQSRAPIRGECSQAPQERRRIHLGSL